MSSLPAPMTLAKGEVKERKQRKCGICRQPGHCRNKCPNNKGIATCNSSPLPKEPRKCTICRQPGHCRNKCPEVNSASAVPIKPRVAETVTIPRSAGGEVQAHGFFWERDIALQVYGVTPEEEAQREYTAKHDIPAELNKLDHCDVSIKVTGRKNTICMADCLRVYDAVSSGETFHMTVIYTKQDGGMKMVTGVIEVDLTSSVELLFGNLKRSDIEELDALIDQVPQKERPTKEQHTANYALRNELHARSGDRSLHLDVKCDSKTSRLHCHFNQFQKFIAENPDRIVSRSETNVFRGGTITPCLESGKRKFLKK